MHLLGTYMGGDQDLSLTDSANDARLEIYLKDWDSALSYPSQLVGLVRFGRLTMLRMAFLA